MIEREEQKGRTDPLLLTPGPLTTSASVKQAMLHDYGSRDPRFITIVREIRSRLLEVGNASPERYTAILMQGSGTFGLEAVLTSAVPRDGKLLLAINGAYGRRLLSMAQVIGIDAAAVEFSENQPVSSEAIANVMTNDPRITHVCMVHCETTSGIMNPIAEVGHIVSQKGREFIVDAMSSFGGVPIHVENCAVDYLISSANKCIQGVPGFSFVLARLAPFLKTKGRSRSLSLDLFEQYAGFQRDGQFRFTPPTSSLAAFHQALLELEEEGGVAARAERYRANFSTLLRGMTRLGFRPFLTPECMGHIITSFYYPDHPAFEFGEFYRRLSEAGFIIYPGKVGQANCFRIGNIGHIFPSDMHALLLAIENVLSKMKIELQSLAIGNEHE